MRVAPGAEPGSLQKRIRCNENFWKSENFEFRKLPIAFAPWGKVDVSKLDENERGPSYAAWPPFRISVVDLRAYMDVESQEVGWDLPKV